MLTRKSAAVLFSFKRIYNILSCVKQVLAIGADVANFLGEFIGKPGCQVGGLISLDCWRGPILEFWKAGTTAENATNNKMYGVLVTNIREHRV